MMKSVSFYRVIYILAIILGVLFLAQPLAAQVDKNELENLGQVEFINYEGPYSRIETRAQIRAIGYSMGLDVKTGSSRSGALGRYFVIHSVSAPDGLKLDADIMGLGVDVGVDHVKNLRLIIQGYLEAAYDYTERDAALLAEYITVYNAVYRGDMEYFGARYKNAVMENLTPEKAGLALRYDEWPGQTLMLIPLGTGLGGPLSSVDTSSISDSRVTESLRQEPDASLDQRKEMIDLKERESEETEQQAAVQREAIRQEEEKIAEERKEAVRQQEEARQEQQQVAQERQQPGADQQALDERERQADEKAREAREQQENLDQRQQEVQEQKRETDRQEAFADQKSEEAQQERQRVAEDQQSVISGEDLSDPASGLLGVSITMPGTSLGRLVRLDANTGKEVKVSPLNTVNVRTVNNINGRIFAVAGEARGLGAIRLVEINSSTLEMQKQGDDDIAPNSLLWVNGQDLYSITNIGTNLYLARFNTELARQARSTVTVHPFSSMLFTDSYVITQRQDGSAVLLNSKDLSEIKEK